MTELAHILPVRLLCTSICFLVALYASFNSVIIYMQPEPGATPIIFAEVRACPIPESGLDFLTLTLFLGAFTGAVMHVVGQLYYDGKS